MLAFQVCEMYRFFEVCLTHCLGKKGKVYAFQRLHLEPPEAAAQTSCIAQGTSAVLLLLICITRSFNSSHKRLASMSLQKATLLSIVSVFY